MESASMAYVYLMNITPEQLSKCWFFNDLLSIAQLTIDEYRQLKDVSFNHDTSENWNIVYDKLLAARKEKWESA